MLTYVYIYIFRDIWRYIYIYTYFIFIIYIYYTYYNSTLLAHSGNKLPVLMPCPYDMAMDSSHSWSTFSRRVGIWKVGTLRIKNGHFMVGKVVVYIIFIIFPWWNDIEWMNPGFLMFSVYCMVHHVQLHPLAAKAPCRCHPADQSEWPVESSRRTWGVLRCC